MSDAKRSGESQQGDLRPASPGQHIAWSKRQIPPVERVRDEIWSIPVPIPDHPMRLTYCYLIVGGDEVVLVDPGWDSDESWEALLDGLALAGVGMENVGGVVITHAHADHHGLTARVVDQSDAWVGMHPREAKSLAEYGRYAEGDASGSRILSGHFRQLGFPAEVIEQVERRPLTSDWTPMAAPDRLLLDEDRIELAGRTVSIIATPGHTPGHLCLYDHDNNLLLTGDHVLPRISPNVSTVVTGEPSPLGDYLVSLGRLKGFGDVEVLPAHEYRFWGLNARLDQLIDHHDERGREIIGALNASGSNPWEVATRISWSRGWDGIAGEMRWAAVAETTAHLELLAQQGRIRRFDPVDGAASEAVEYLPGPTVT